MTTYSHSRVSTFENCPYFKGNLHKEIIDKIKIEKDWRISLSKRKDMEE
ncbi:MAG: hypothetical protein WC711_03965 [Candidatus Staskawiczbacteria bacterium]|jgi:hypothetical protein